jgi:triosephosphate isomerase (TIM)
MTDGLVPLVAGNWKMNGLRRDLDEIRAIAGASAHLPRPEILICPPATLLMAAAEICAGTAVRLGGQDCHDEPSGTHTGDLSAEMLADAGAAYVILGHSERRAEHGETSEEVRIKAHAALRAGLMPIICVGETRAEREAGEALALVGAQLKASIPPHPGTGLVVAYEPIWAIGTGHTPTPTEVAEMHTFIRSELGIGLGVSGTKVRLLYGGSVRPENVKEWVAIDNVNGVLVGGASLKSADFMQIVKAFQ